MEFDKRRIERMEWKRQELVARGPGRRPPTNEVGATAGVDLVLFRSEHSAAHLGCVRVFSTGILFEVGLAIDFRADEMFNELRRDFLSALRSTNSDTAVWFGVRSADGRRATNSGEPRPLTVNDDDLKLTRLPPGTMGTMGMFSSIFYFLTPATTDSLTVVLAWPAGHIEESSVVIDGDRLKAAREQLVTLWPASDETGTGDAKTAPPIHD